MSTRFFFFALLFNSFVISKSYFIDNLSINSKITSIGEVHIEETRVFVFNGSYRFAYLDLDKNSFGEIFDIKVLDGDLHFQNSDSKAKNTFVIIDKKNTVRIKWFFIAEDTSRTFKVSYKLKGATRVGENDSQFYWTYLDKGWGVKTFNMLINQSFESESTNNDKVWYDIKGISEKKVYANFDNQIISVRISDISKNKSVKMNTIFPSNYIKSALVTDNSFSKENELEQYRSNQYWSNVGIYASIFFIFMSLITFLRMFLRYGKEYSVDYSALDGNNNFPSKHHPALVSYLISYQKLTGYAILATLFRLAHLNYFKLEKEQTTKKSFFSKKEKIEEKISIKINDEPVGEKLKEWDIILKNFLMLEIKNGTRFLDDIFTKISAASFLRKDWTKLVDQTIIENNWLEKPPKNEVTIFFLIHTAMVIASLFLIKYNPFLSIISGIIILVIGIAVSFGMKRMSYDCAMVKKKWESFGEKISSIIEKSNIDNNEILQYSIVLGLESESIKGLLKSFNYESSDFMWFYGANDSEFADMVDYGIVLGTSFAGDGGAGDGGGGGGGGGGGAG